MEAYDKIKQLVNGEYKLENKDIAFDLEKDIQKFQDKGTVAAGQRIRLLMRELIKLSKELRDDTKSNN